MRMRMRMREMRADMTVECRGRKFVAGSLE